MCIRDRNWRGWICREKRVESVFRRLQQHGWRDTVFVLGRPRLEFLRLKGKPYKIYESKSASGRGWLRILLGVFLVLVIVGVAAAGGIYLWLDHLAGEMPKDPNQQDIQAAISETTEPQQDNLEEKPEVTNILVMGSDVRDPGGESYGRSDTLIVVHMDLTEGFASVLSIPRDLRVNVPGYGKQKINAAFALGGLALAIRTVQQNLAIDLDQYVHVDFQGFSEITEALGGIYAVSYTHLRAHETVLDLV